MLEKLNRLKNWQVALIFAATGFAVYFDSLKNRFLGDDGLQIVNNVPVHSLTHLAILFEGSTFYAGRGLAPLSGYYYRPLMMTVYSLVYTLFGPHPFYFHLVQLLFCVGAAYILYLFFRYSFTLPLALFLSMVFLLHPFNSEVVFEIAALQDAMYFFFGILAIWLLLRFKSKKGLFLVAASLFLSLLSKESGILFVIVAALYLLVWNRKRLISFATFMIVPVSVWLTLRIHAIGFPASNNGPIDNLSLAGRLMSEPSILLFYISKFIFPIKLASVYYWVYPKFSISHVLVPLLVDLIVVGLFIYLANYVRVHESKAVFYTYIFFFAWCALGLLLVSQVIPLDTTVSDAWFYFPVVGLLGMLGIIWNSLRPLLRLNPLLQTAMLIVIILSLGVGTIIRGTNWRNWYTLATSDLRASKQDYGAYNILAENFANQGNYAAALVDENKAISIFPTSPELGDAGTYLFFVGNYSSALVDEQQALRFLGPTSNHQVASEQKIYETISFIMTKTGNEPNNISFISGALAKYPHDANLLYNLAVLAYEEKNYSLAKQAITKAYTYNQGSAVSAEYDLIVNHKS